MTYYTDDRNKVEYDMDKAIEERAKIRCMKCEEKETYYLAGFADGFEAGQSALTMALEEKE